MAQANTRAPSFTVAVDVMGSDYAPAEVVKGAVAATQGGGSILGGDGAVVIGHGRSKASTVAP